MISVLLPTRNRPKELARSIISLMQNADERIEILLAFDEDDTSDYRAVMDVIPAAGHRVYFRTCKRYGYAQLHRYYNDLAAVATGDWLFLWNDDCVMETVGWDSAVTSQEPRYVLSPHSENDPLTTFPIVPRAFTEALGHYAEILHVDTWWQELGKKLDILKWIDVHLSHRRFDLVSGVEEDDVYRERAFVLHEFFQPQMQALHNRDVETIRQLIS